MEAANPKISIVIPVFNEEEVLPLLYQRLCQLAERLPLGWEWIFVNDGSRDNTYPLLQRLAQQDTRVKVLHFSRNFGHQIAITAGIDFTHGEAVVVMDADLQHPPEVIPELYAIYEQGYDVVYARRRVRQGESWFKIGSAAFFYWFMQKFIHRQLPQNVGDFRLMSRRVVEALRYLPEKHRFYRGLVTWSGFKQTAYDFDCKPRAAGKSKYSLGKMLRFALDAIFSFSYMPLRVAGFLGLGMVFLSFIYLLWQLYNHFCLHDTIRGWTSIITLLIVLHGVTLVCIGLLGEYTGRIYEEIKHRPLYIVQEMANLDCHPGRGFTGGVVVSGPTSHVADRTPQPPE